MASLWRCLSRGKLKGGVHCVALCTAGLLLAALLALLCVLPEAGNAVAGALGGVALLLALMRGVLTACSLRAAAQQTMQPDARPVTQAAIDKIGVVCTNAQLPSVLVQKVPEACWTQCCVCLHPMRPHATVRGLSCGHVFHKKCIDDWFRVALGAELLRCPLCRASALVRPDLRRPPSPQPWRALYSVVIGARFRVEGEGSRRGVIHV